MKFLKQLLLQYIFKRQDYNKPFFSTFAKTSMFVLYLLGFLLWRPWRQQCTGTLKRRRSAFVSGHFQRTFKGCFSCFYFSNGDRCLSSSFLLKTLISVNVAVLTALHRNTSQWGKHTAQGELTLWTCLFRGSVPPVCLRSRDFKKNRIVLIFNFIWTGNHFRFKSLCKGRPAWKAHMTVSDNADRRETK